MSSTVSGNFTVVDFRLSGFEVKHYANDVFLGVAEAFVEAWYRGLLFQLKPIPVLITYFSSHGYFSQFAMKSTDCFRVPECSIHAPVLYIVYSTDTPRTF